MLLCFTLALESTPMTRCPFWCHWPSAAGENYLLVFLCSLWRGCDSQYQYCDYNCKKPHWLFPPGCSLSAGWGSRPTCVFSCWLRKNTSCPCSWQSPWWGTASVPSSSSHTWMPWTVDYARSVLHTNFLCVSFGFLSFHLNLLSLSLESNKYWFNILGLRVFTFLQR